MFVAVSFNRRCHQGEREVSKALNAPGVHVRQQENEETVERAKLEWREDKDGDREPKDNVLLQPRSGGWRKWG